MHKGSFMSSQQNTKLFLIERTRAHKQQEFQALLLYGVCIKHTGVLVLVSSPTPGSLLLLAYCQNLLEEHTGFMNLPLSDGQCVHLISHLTKPEITALNECL